MQNLTLASLAAAIFILANPVQAQSMSGSRTSMERQYQEAIKYGYTFIETSQTVSRFVENGHLVKVGANANFDLHAVSYPYARPAVKLFVERLSAQYRAACGEKLTVTSLTRPMDRQPANAADDSVHPAGMAVDLRIPSHRKCRSWLESTLLSLEKTGVLDATRERHPPHYHVAVYTETYEQYVDSMSGSSWEYVVRKGDTLSKIASLTGMSIPQIRAVNGLSGDLINIGQTLQVVSDQAAPAVAAAPVEVEAPREESHRVRRGETLWRIARLYGTSVSLLRRENGLANDLLQVGQVLRITLGQSGSADN